MSAPKSIHIALVEKNRLLRESLATRLRAEKDMDILSAPSLEHLPQLSKEVDVIMTECGVANLAQMNRVRETLPDAALIATNVESEELDLVACVQLGVRGFVLKDAASSNVVATVRAVSAGARVFPMVVVDSLCNQLYDRGKARGPLCATDRITIRERQIIQFVVEGLSNKEIAAKLNIAIHTVKCHVHNVLEKLQLNNRVELVNRCWRDRNVSYKYVPQAMPRSGWEPLFVEENQEIVTNYDTGT